MSLSGHICHTPEIQYGGRKTENSLKSTQIQDITTTNEIAPATPILTTTPVSAMTLADTRNSKWRPPKSFSFQNSESGVVEMWGVAVETASPSPSVQKLIISASILQFAVCTCRFSSVKPPFWCIRSVETRSDDIVLQKSSRYNWPFKPHLSTWSDSGATH